MNIMIDLETLGTSSNTMILTFAAVPFIPKTGEIKGEIFYEKIDIDSYKQYQNFTFDGSTLTWWMTTAPEQARKEAFGGIRKPLKTVMENFKLWCEKFKMPIKIWSHGSCFDVVIVSHAMNTLNLSIPWKFWDIRDTRTIYDLANIILKNVAKCSSFPDHHALGDCYHQIEALKESYSIISKKQKTDV